MIDPTWELLSKSQTDPETIEQAIDRLVAAHNDDIVAHIGTGRSISAHREDPILDHVPGSALIDKGTMNEFVVTTCFEDISHWITGGSVNNDDFPGMNLYVESGAVPESKAWLNPQIPINYNDLAFNSFFQATILFNMSVSNLYCIFAHTVTDATPSDGWGFEMQSGGLKPWYWDGSSVQYGPSYVTDFTKAHVYRIQYDAFTNTLDYYVDGDLAFSTTGWAQGGPDDSGPGFWARDLGGSDGNIRIGSLTFARSMV